MSVTPSTQPSPTPVIPDAALREVVEWLALWAWPAGPGLPQLLFGIVAEATAPPFLSLILSQVGFPGDPVEICQPAPPTWSGVICVLERQGSAPTHVSAAVGLTRDGCCWHSIVSATGSVSGSDMQGPLVDDLHLALKLGEIRGLLAKFETERANRAPGWHP